MFDVLPVEEYAKMNLAQLEKQGNRLNILLREHIDYQDVYAVSVLHKHLNIVHSYSRLRRAEEILSDETEEIKCLSSNPDIEFCDAAELATLLRRHDAKLGWGSGWGIEFKGHSFFITSPKSKLGSNVDDELPAFMAELKAINQQWADIESARQLHG